MPEPDSEVMYGTLDLIVLKALDTLWPLHGFGMAERIHQPITRTGRGRLGKESEEWGRMAEFIARVIQGAF